ncbi:MAG: NADPH:quinone reductase, partial [Mycobacterium sp.]|nr:NADPH:quinone reductase [Mycobacterium sp.]
MKALVARELSGPSGLDYTDVDDVDGDDAVVIDVGAAGVSFPDLLLLRGEYQLRLEPPFIPGMEVAGIVRS